MESDDVKRERILKRYEKILEEDEKTEVPE